MQRYTGFWRKNIGLKIMTDKPKTEEKRGLRPKSKGDLAGRPADGIKKPVQHPVDAAGVCF